MDQVTNFDVLIVYSEKLANSASFVSEIITAPFPKGSDKESYNLVYSYFLKTCQKNNLKAAFTTSADIVGAGLVRSYWLFENETWIKIRKTGFSKMIFDKFSPTSKKIGMSRNLLFSSKRVRAFNNPRLFNLCFDKQETYNKLHKFSIPTVTIDGRTRKSVDKALKMLKRRMARHQHKDDFSEELIMKDRFGAGGINIYKFKASQSNMMTASMNKHKKISFIIQPLIKFNKGFSYKNSLASTDIRLIYLGNKIVQTYIRIAKKGNFRCNEHSGGLLKYIPKNEVPSKVMAVSRNIAKILNQKTSLSRAFAKSVDYQSADKHSLSRRQEANAKSQTCPAKREYRGLSASGSLFALDFIISNNGNIYLLEANTGPGLDWNSSIKENEIEAKKLMRIIIKEIARRINSLKSTSEKKVVVPTIDIPPIGGYQYSPNLLITTQTT